MHKKPIYGSRIYSDMSTSDTTFCNFRRKLIQHHRGFSGAAQDMDLFMHTRSFLTQFLATGGLILSLWRVINWAG